MNQIDIDDYQTSELVDYLRNWLERTDFDCDPQGVEIRDKYSPLDIAQTYIPRALDVLKDHLKEAQ